MTESEIRAAQNRMRRYDAACKSKDYQALEAHYVCQATIDAAYEVYDRIRSRAVNMRDREIAAAAMLFDARVDRIEAQYREERGMPMPANRQLTA